MVNYDSDFDHIDLFDRKEFQVYMKQIQNLLSDEPLTTGEIHRQLGRDHDNWTLHALEYLVEVAEQKQYGNRQAWVKRDLKKLPKKKRLKFTLSQRKQVLG